MCSAYYDEADRNTDGSVQCESRFSILKFPMLIKLSVHAVVDGSYGRLKVNWFYKSLLSSKYTLSCVLFCYRTFRRSMVVYINKSLYH